MQSRQTLGDLLRSLRESRQLPIRKVAAIIDIDPSTLSKIERNQRMIKRSDIEKLASFFKVDEKLLLINYWSDKITRHLKNEDCSIEVLNATKEKLLFFKEKDPFQNS